MQKFRRALKKCGFTLVELIVVIAILGVLAAILIPTFLGFTRQANTASANKTATELEKIDQPVSHAGGRKRKELYVVDGRCERGLYDNHNGRSVDGFGGTASGCFFT